MVKCENFVDSWIKGLDKDIREHTKSCRKCKEILKELEDTAQESSRLLTKDEQQIVERITQNSIESLRNLNELEKQEEREFEDSKQYSEGYMGKKVSLLLESYLKIGERDFDKNKGIDSRPETVNYQQEPIIDKLLELLEIGEVSFLEWLGRKKYRLIGCEAGTFSDYSHIQEHEEETFSLPLPYESGVVTRSGEIIEIKLFLSQKLPLEIKMRDEEWEMLTWNDVEKCFEYECDISDLPLNKGHRDIVLRLSPQKSRGTESE